MNRWQKLSTALLCVATCAASAQGYRITTLDPAQPYYTIIPFGINDAGIVTGEWTDPALVDHGFLAQGGSFRSFDAPAADTVKVIAIRGTWASGIDNAGTVVGTYTAGGAQHGFLRNAAGATSTLDIPGHLHTGLGAMNSTGQILGSYADSNAVLGGTSFLRDPGGALTVIAMPGSTFSAADGMNDAGVIVGGYYDAANALHGYMRSAAGVYSTVDVPGATATFLNSINNAGWSIGEYDVGATAHAFVRDPSGAIVTLDGPGASFTSGTGINNLGDIVGQYCDAANVCHGFIGAPVPEPDAWLMMAAGLLAATRLRRLRGSGGATATGTSAAPRRSR